MSIILSSSILAADFGRLEEQARTALETGVDWLHVDVMDGHFVPNITIGPLVVRALRPVADDFPQALLDVHLMIQEPERYLDDFAAAGADIITVHVETCPHLHRTLQMIRELGVRPGVTLNPATPVTAIEEIAPLADLILVMSVNPGFGGQSYIPGSTAKIARIRRLLDDARSEAWLSVDGGVKPKNAAEIVAAGATVLVAGSAVFNKATTISENVAAFRAAIGGER